MHSGLSAHDLAAGNVALEAGDWPQARGLPREIAAVVQLAQTIAAGQPVTGVTAADIDAMNAGHATEHAAVTKDVAVDLLRHNSAAASAAVRALTDEQLASAAPVSLYADAPLTCQFVLEDRVLDVAAGNGNATLASAPLRAGHLDRLCPLAPRTRTRPRRGGGA